VVNQPAETNLGWELGPGTPGLVSVVVIAFNQAWCLAETLRSVAAQTYRPLECVIVDDGSTDETAEIGRTFAQQHRGDIAVVPLAQENRGAQEARNTGVRSSRGEFIQFLDGDDLLAPTKIADQMAFFSSAEGMMADVVYGDGQWLHEDEHRMRFGDRFGIGPSNDMLETMLTTDSFNASFSYLTRRAAIERTGQWKRLPINDDVDFFFRLTCTVMQQGRGFVYLPISTGYYRKHQRARMSDGGTLKRSLTNLEIYADLETQMRGAGVLTPPRTKALARAYYEVSCSASMSDAAVARRSLAEALRLDPAVGPRRPSARLLQRLIGTWRAESLLRLARRLKHRVPSDRRSLRDSDSSGPATMETSRTAAPRRHS
jgi:GT2 family glycosyltransferase